MMPKRSRRFIGQQTAQVHRVPAYPQKAKKQAGVPLAGQLKLSKASLKQNGVAAVIK
jgi:hypothetical protein